MIPKGQQQLYTHHEAGQFYVHHVMFEHPLGKPYFCDGRYYASEDAAVVGFALRWEVSKNGAPVEDTSYARMEARMISPGVFED